MVKRVKPVSVHYVKVRPRPKVIALHCCQRWSRAVWVKLNWSCNVRLPQRALQVAAVAVEIGQSL